MDKQEKKRDMRVLMAAAMKIVEEITSRMEDPVENVTVERSRYSARLFVDVQNDKRMIYRYDDALAAFAHEKTVSLWD